MSRLVIIFCIGSFVFLTFILVGIIETKYVFIHKSIKESNENILSCVNNIASKQLGVIISFNLRSANSDNYLEITVRNEDGNFYDLACYPQKKELKEITSNTWKNLIKF